MTFSETVAKNGPQANGILVLLFCGLFALLCYLLSIPMTTILQGVSGSLETLILTSLLISLYILSPKPEIGFRWWIVVVSVCSIYLCFIGGLFSTPDSWLECIVGTSLMLAVVTLLEQKIAQCLRDPFAAQVIAITLYLCCLSTPLWMSPICLLFPQSSVIADTSIALSPLSYFAVLIESDYLRSDWFYRSTVYGGIRYQYPSICTYLQIQAVVLVLLYYIKSPVRRTGAVS